MPYAMPPQTNSNTTGTGTDYSHVQPWQGQRSSRARQTASAMAPGGAVLDIMNDAAGRPLKAHVREANGHMRTLTFDANQNITQSQDGYC